MKRSLHAELLKAFLNNAEVLRRAGWVIADESSPAWWDDLMSPQEVAIAAILVQLNSWEKVKEAVVKLREKGLADLRELAKLSVEEIDKEISSINFHRTKAERLKRLSLLYETYGERALKDYSLLRSVKGIGEETAKAIMLFAGNVKAVPPSEYLARVLSRVEGVRLDKAQAAREVEEAFDRLFDLKLFYAGITAVGKLFCKPRPRCNECIISSYCKYYREAIRMGGEGSPLLPRGKGAKGGPGDGQVRGEGEVRSESPSAGRGEGEEGTGEGN